MKSKEELESDFRNDLELLLIKHGAEIEITDDNKDYGMHSGIVVITIMSKWNKNNELIRNFCEFQL